MIFIRPKIITAETKDTILVINILSAENNHLSRARANQMTISIKRQSQVTQKINCSDQYIFRPAWRKSNSDITIKTTKTTETIVQEKLAGSLGFSLATS